VVLGDLVYNKDLSEKVEVVSSFDHVGEENKINNDDDNETLDIGPLDDEIPDIIHLSEETTSVVKAVTKEDLIAGNYTVEDVLLPLPGSRVIYPRNEIEKVFKDLANKDSISLTNTVHSIKEFSLTSMTGAYRRVFQKPKDFNWEVLNYTDGNIPVAETDLDAIAKKTEAESDCKTCLGGLENNNNSNGDNNNEGLVQKALKMSFTLPASCYATMAIRELLKTSTSVAFHKMLN
jgi:tRNA pseudouridine13 synthase